MSLEQVLEQTAHARPGYDLVSFKEAGLPVFVLRLRILVLERKAISPIEEAVLKTIQAGLDGPGSIFEFLGLPKAVLTPVLAGLNTDELINYSRTSADVDAKVTLSAKGRKALAEAATVRPQERVVPVCFDALTKKLLVVSPEQLYRARDMRNQGRFEVPIGTAKRPVVEDVRLEDFDKVLERQSTPGETTGSLLAVRRIERSELQYMGCVMLFYKSQSQPNDIEVGFWREDGQATEHEVAFQTIGGPDLVGARVLAANVGAPPDVSASAEVVPIEGLVTGPAIDQVPTASPAQVRGNSGSPEQPASVETMRTLLCHEHPAFLKKALISAKRRLMIISPWISHWVVDWQFVASLEALLRQGVEVHIGYGIANADGGNKKNAARGKPDITPDAAKDLNDLAVRFKNFHFVHVGNTHRKSLVCDEDFAVVTSFNWLSYKGDSRDRPRDERGIVVSKKHHVKKLAEEELELLTKGYSNVSQRS